MREWAVVVFCAVLRKRSDNRCSHCAVGLDIFLHRASSRCLGSTMQHVLAAKSKGSDIRSVRRIDARALGSCGGGVKKTVA